MGVIICYLSGILCISSAIMEVHKKQFAEEGTKGGLLGFFFDFFFYKYLFTHLKQLKGALFQFLLGLLLMGLAWYLNRDAGVF